MPRSYTRIPSHFDVEPVTTRVEEITSRTTYGLQRVGKGKYM